MKQSEGNIAYKTQLIVQIWYERAVQVSWDIF